MNCYTIILSDGPVELEKLVNEYINRGYMLCGGVAVSSYVVNNPVITEQNVYHQFAQAVWKPPTLSHGEPH